MGNLHNAVGENRKVTVEVAIPPENVIGINNTDLGRRGDVRLFAQSPTIYDTSQYEPLATHALFL